MKNLIRELEHNMRLICDLRRSVEVIKESDRTERAKIQALTLLFLQTLSLTQDCLLEISRERVSLAEGDLVETYKAISDSLLAKMAMPLDSKHSLNGPPFASDDQKWARGNETTSV